MRKRLDRAVAKAFTRDSVQAFSKLSNEVDGERHIVSEPPSIDKGEVTDKGSINQRAVLKHRDALVTALHDGSAPNIIQPEA